MPRYALKIEYDGLPYCGWQRQTSLPTVQGAIEDALAKLEPREHAIVAAGRTDTGVHATGQVAHCDMEKDWGTFRLSEALNYHLKPAPVAITACVRVDDDWHARFSALERRYLFRLVSRRAPLILETGKIWQVRQPLDLAAMQEAAKRLLGRHDFTTFRSTICQANSPMRTLDVLDIEQVDRRDGAQEFNFHVRARSFLHNQVRSFVGTLERVGAGSWTPDDVTAALEAKDRNRCGPVCPPQGLYLAEVGYPEDPFA
ncbi:tRNA pseudouridine(38-40) synthase TruA [Octadecabacter ascidiaceicola]|uniref:tRNA pseudouridine synthase A n=1 Tax=Octadecabacter ascidiaceicola TaxID=1655543 RepID=A0A238JUG7_9RHOB|nr:tRNA pseudouridine(38-40) synthase TruA [Octadecabacter ascidiaceicola]SMX33834.1 tRNA pseudouridine synthase A [Octadecabacter ascidiaceicola]